MKTPLIYLAYAIFGVTVLAGCSTLGTTPKKDTPSLSATQSEQSYYAQAQTALDNAHYAQAITNLTDLRIFYPAGNYAEQALLDLIYAHYQAEDYEAVSTAVTQFLQSYPNSRHADYALYAQGVAHMQGSPKASQFIKLNQSERDTAYLQLAFADFEQLIKRYPNSPYASDATQRMTYLYNQFAHHELTAAYWYLKQKAYLAAFNRASWVFLYYPKSTAIPESIAILAYSAKQLGLDNQAQTYKRLLQINYPNYLDGDHVRLPTLQTNPLQKTLSLVSFGLLGRPSTIDPTGQSTYQGATSLQVIEPLPTH